MAAELMFWVTLFTCTVLSIVGVLLSCRYWRSRTVDPSGKTVIITGCDSGFGNELARRLQHLGYKVFACCLDSSSDGAKELLKMGSRRMKLIQLDVTSDDQIQTAKMIVQQECQNGGVWALVNNAGVAVFAETEWCTMEHYEHVMNVNLMGMIRMTKAFLSMIRKSEGRVINVSSLAGRIALPGFTAYSASKFAVIGFSDSLRREMRKFGVLVITVEPHLFRSPLTGSDLHVQLNEKMWSRLSKATKADYGEDYFEAFIENMKQMLVRTSKRTFLVIDDLTHAVTADYPRIRYVPKLHHYIGGNILQALPNSIQDLAIENVMSFDTKPDILLRQ